MDVHLSSHSEELVRQQLAHGNFRSAEEVIEQALKSFLGREPGGRGEEQRSAVRDLLEFLKQNRVRIEPGVSAKDLIHEGHRM